MIPRRAEAAELPEVLALIRAEFAYLDGVVDPPSTVHRPPSTVHVLTLEALAAAVELATRVELVANQRAFERMGFVEVARAAHPGFDRPTAIVYQRGLDPKEPT